MKLKLKTCNTVLTSLMGHNSVDGVRKVEVEANVAHGAHKFEIQIAVPV